MKLKNKTIRIWSDRYQVLHLTVYDKNPKNDVLSQGTTFKFDGFMEGVDVETLVPARCKKEYARIIKVS